MTERHPEADVLDAIDALVDEQLAPGPVDDYHVNRYDKCALCRSDFHGLRNIYGCPGAYGTDTEIAAWRNGVVLQSRPSIVLGGREPRWLTNMVEASAEYVQDQIEVITGVRGYTIADLMEMRGGFQGPHGYGIRERQPLQFPRDPGVGSYAYQEHFAPQPVEPVYLGTRITSVRFFGVVGDTPDPQTMQATLEIIPPDDGYTLTLPVLEGSPWTFTDATATLEIAAADAEVVYPQWELTEGTFEIPNLPAVIE